MHICLDKWKEEVSKGGEKVQTAVSRVIIQSHLLAHFARPSIVRQVVVGAVTCMKSCLGPQGFRLLMIELYESSHTLLKPLPKGLFGTSLHVRHRWRP